ncbi:hypothetical protein V6N12_076067 [Hibiscus sabdariffa]|uniref:Secreted protein n=1 Tax=Hibiscus sabdariffa TaxID=183260 RepID=A0ABR2AY98_9ROSI
MGGMLGGSPPFVFFVFGKAGLSLLLDVLLPTTTGQGYAFDRGPFFAVLPCFPAFTPKGKKGESFHSARNLPPAITDSNAGIRLYRFNPNAWIAQEHSE